MHEHIFLFVSTKGKIRGESVLARNGMSYADGILLRESEKNMEFCYRTLFFSWNFVTMVKNTGYERGIDHVV